MRLSADEWAMLVEVGKGIADAENFMGELTDYHGDAVKTEYLLSVGIARALLGTAMRQIELEYLLNGLRYSVLAHREKPWTLGSQRFDVAVLDAVLPMLMIEAKIRVRSLHGPVETDLGKLIDFLMYLKLECALKMLGASVFQVHVTVPMDPGELVEHPSRKRRVRLKSPRRQCLAETRQRVNDLEITLKAELVAIAAARPGFEFCWVEFQGTNDRIHDDEIDWEGDGEDALQVLGRPGYACRYHGILVRRLEDPPAPGRCVGPLFVHRDAPELAVVEEELVA